MTINPISPVSSSPTVPSSSWETRFDLDDYYHAYDHKEDKDHSLMVSPLSSKCMTSNYNGNGSVSTAPTSISSYRDDDASPSPVLTPAAPTDPHPPPLPQFDSMVDKPFQTVVPVVQLQPREREGSPGMAPVRDMVLQIQEEEAEVEARRRSQQEQDHSQQDEESLQPQQEQRSRSRSRRRPSSTTASRRGTKALSDINFQQWMTPRERAEFERRKEYHGDDGDLYMDIYDDYRASLMSSRASRASQGF